MSLLEYEIICLNNRLPPGGGYVHTVTSICKTKASVVIARFKALHKRLEEFSRLLIPVFAQFLQE